MQSADYDLGPAHVQVDEWIGTAAAEADMNRLAEELYDVVELDRDVWSILAVDFYDGTSRERSEVDVYAVNRTDNDLSGMSHDKLLDLAHERGSIPVTQFKVHGVEAERIIKHVFKRYAVRLRSRGIGDHILHVEKRDDLRLVRPED